MKVHVISDLHNDIGDTPVQIPQDDIPVLVCGDISNNIFEGIDWIKKNIKQGYVIAGNHDSCYGNIPIEDVHAMMRKAFPKGGPVVFLENDHVVKGNTVIVGATLWSEKEARKIEDGRFQMNSYNLGIVRNPDGSQRPFTPEDAHKRNKATLAYLAAICKKYPSKNIVVMTHHPPSEQSLPADERGKNSEYANSLEKFIVTHPNIKVWAHGHVHMANGYKIGNCRVISNPRGYNDAKRRHRGLTAAINMAMDQDIEFGQEEFDALNKALCGQETKVDLRLLAAAKRAIREKGRLNPEFDPNWTVDLPVELHSPEKNRDVGDVKSQKKHFSTLKQTLANAQDKEKKGFLHSVMAFFTQGRTR